MLIKIISFFSYCLFLFEFILFCFPYVMVGTYSITSWAIPLMKCMISHLPMHQIFKSTFHLFPFFQSFVAYIQSLNVNTNPRTWTWLHPNCFLQWHSHKYVGCWLTLNPKLFLHHICEVMCWSSTQKWRFWKNLTKLC